MSESPCIAGSPEANPPKEGHNLQNRAHKNEFTAKDDDALLSSEAFFFRFPFFGYRIWQQFWGVNKKMLFIVLWEFTLNFPHPHWRNNPIYGTGEMEKSREKPSKICNLKNHGISNQWWFGNPRTLRHTDSIPSILEGPSLGNEKSTIHGTVPNHNLLQHFEIISFQ